MVALYYIHVYVPKLMGIHFFHFFAITKGAAINMLLVESFFFLLTVLPSSVISRIKTYGLLSHFLSITSVAFQNGCTNSPLHQQCLNTSLSFVCQFVGYGAKFQSTFDVHFSY